MVIGSSTLADGVQSLRTRSQLQWQPTLQVHDPSDVLTLIDPDPPPASGEAFHEQVGIGGGMERGVRLQTAAGLGGVLVT